MLRKTSTTIISLTFLMIFHTPSPALANCSSALSFKEGMKYAVYMLIDRSGSLADQSINQTSKSLEDAAHFVTLLPPGTLLFGRWISQESHLSTELFLIDTIPAIPPSIETNCPIYDLPCKKEKRQQINVRKCAIEASENARNRIVKFLKTLKPERACCTNIWAGVWATGQDLNPYTQYKKFVVLWSDLGDTVGMKLPTDASMKQGLKDAHILIRSARTANPIKLNGWLSTFKKRLDQFGTHVELLPLGTPWVGNLIARK